MGGGVTRNRKKWSRAAVRNVIGFAVIDVNRDLSQDREGEGKRKMRWVELGRSEI
jgi:hypothetical protein